MSRPLPGSVAAPSSCPTASKAQRVGITALSPAPAPAIRLTGRIAPENSTAGKHSIGKASVACATFLTLAEVSRPKPSAAIAHSSRPVPIEAYVDSGRLGSRSIRRSTPSIATTTSTRNGTSTVTLDAT